MCAQDRGSGVDDARASQTLNQLVRLKPALAPSASGGMSVVRRAAAAAAASASAVRSRERRKMRTFSSRASRREVREEHRKGE